ncbi:MAG: hypothetical protein KUG72_12925 [Pseudomonadales bacterium]|nr:hypothetical protein [Pseudomonadales bacterium]
MNNQSRRVLLTLSGHTSNTATLDIVAEFAAAIHAEINGLFIEDKTLLDIAALPFTREIRSHGLQPGQLEVSTLEHQMRMLSDAAQRELNSCAQRWKIQCSFNTAPSGFEHWLRSQEDKENTLCIAHKIDKKWGSTQYEIDTSRLLEQHSGPLMLLPKKQGSGKELIGIIHSSDSIEAILKPIENLVKKGHQPVIILLCDNPPETEKIKRSVIYELEKKALQATVHILRPATNRSLLQFIDRHMPKLMIVGADNPIIDSTCLNELIESSGAPVLLLREQI